MLLVKCGARSVLSMCSKVERQKANRQCFDTIWQMMQVKVEPSVADQDIRSLMNHDV